MINFSGETANLVKSHRRAGNSNLERAPARPVTRVAASLSGRIGRQLRVGERSHRSCTEGAKRHSSNMAYGDLKCVLCAFCFALYFLSSLASSFFLLRDLLGEDDVALRCSQREEERKKGGGREKEAVEAGEKFGRLGSATRSEGRGFTGLEGGGLIFLKASDRPSVRPSWDKG